MKDKQIHIRISDEEKERLKKDAIKAGFDCVSHYLMWLWRTKKS